MTEPVFKIWLIGWRGRRAFVIATAAAKAKGPRVEEQFGCP